jgi:hypothetical protein
MFSVLDGINLVEKYAVVPADDDHIIPKCLAVILYCYQSLQYGSTSWTLDSEFMSMDAVPIDPKIKEERKQRLRLAAQLACLKLNNICVSHEYYFAPKTVEIMKRLFLL